MNVIYIYKLFGIHTPSLLFEVKPQTPARFDFIVGSWARVIAENWEGKRKIGNRIWKQEKLLHEYIHTEFFTTLSWFSILEEKKRAKVCVLFWWCWRERQFQSADIPIVTPITLQYNSDQNFRHHKTSISQHLFFLIVFWEGEKYNCSKLWGL